MVISIPVIVILRHIEPRPIRRPYRDLFISLLFIDMYTNCNTLECSHCNCLFGQKVWFRLATGTLVPVLNAHLKQSRNNRFASAHFKTDSYFTVYSGTVHLV